MKFDTATSTATLLLALSLIASHSTTATPAPAKEPRRISYVPASFLELAAKDIKQWLKIKVYNKRGTTPRDDITKAQFEYFKNIELLKARVVHKRQLMLAKARVLLTIHTVRAFGSFHETTFTTDQKQAKVARIIRQAVVPTLTAISTLQYRVSECLFGQGKPNECYAKLEGDIHNPERIRDEGVRNERVHNKVAAFPPSAVPGIYILHKDAVEFSRMLEERGFKNIFPDDFKTVSNYEDIRQLFATFVKRITYLANPASQALAINWMEDDAVEQLDTLTRRIPALIKELLSEDAYEDNVALERLKHIAIGQVARSSKVSTLLKNCIEELTTANGIQVDADKSYQKAITKAEEAYLDYGMILTAEMKDNKFWKHPFPPSPSPPSPKDRATSPPPATPENWTGADYDWYTSQIVLGTFGKGIHPYYADATLRYLNELDWIRAHLNPPSGNFNAMHSSSESNNATPGSSSYAPFIDIDRQAHFQWY